jgi:hypothetical protein
VSDETSGESVQEKSIKGEVAESALSDTERESLARIVPTLAEVRAGARTALNLHARMQGRRIE